MDIVRMVICTTNNMRVITRCGYPKLSLIKEKTDVWDGNDWVSISTETHNSQSAFIRVCFLDGSYVELDENTIVELHSKTKKRAADIKTGDAITSFDFLFHGNSPTITTDYNDPIYKKGNKMGLASEHDLEKILSEKISLEGMQMLIYGWADKYGGHLIGKRETLELLQISIRRYGINCTCITGSDEMSNLFISEKNIDIFGLGNGVKFNFYQKLKNSCQKVLSVKKCKHPKVVEISGTSSIVLNNVCVRT